jgi:hypothetical protein
LRSRRLVFWRLRLICDVMLAKVFLRKIQVFHGLSAIGGGVRRGKSAILHEGA